jgi:choline dehydrogenase-like flavoprotein
VCTLALRLRQGNPTLSILIIEAGIDPVGHPLTSSPLASFAAHETDINGLITQHLKLRSTIGKSTRQLGKALSGGSATNYGTWTRGAAVDYDH